MANKNKCFSLHYPHNPETDNRHQPRWTWKCGVTDCGHKLITACKMPAPVWKVRCKWFDRWLKEVRKMAAETEQWNHLKCNVSHVRIYGMNLNTGSKLHKKPTWSTRGRSTAICHTDAQMMIFYEENRFVSSPRSKIPKLLPVRPSLDSFRSRERRFSCALQAKTHVCLFVLRQTAI